MSAVSTLVLLLSMPAWGTTPEAISAAVTEYNSIAHEPIPMPEAKDLDALCAGELVRIRVKFDDPELPQQVVGLQLVSGTKEEIWVSTHDEHYTYLEEITSAYVGKMEGRDLWYQFFDAPWPFTDRHWIISVWDNVTMVESTGGRMWEHPWELPEGGEPLADLLLEQGKVEGITVDMGEKALYTPVNHGGWLAITLPDGQTLFGYHVTSVIGGGIPDGLVARFSMHSLKKVFGEAIARLPEIREHYDSKHVAIQGGHGRPIDPFAEVALAPGETATPTE